MASLRDLMSRMVITVVLMFLSGLVFQSKAQPFLACVDRVVNKAAAGCLRADFAAVDAVIDEARASMCQSSCEYTSPRWCIFVETEFGMCGKDYGPFQDNATAIINCPAGSRHNGDNQCICPTGSLWNESTFSCSDCPVGHKWVNQASACIPIVDRYGDRPQACQPSGGNPIYPLTATKRYDEVLLPDFGMTGFRIRYDTRSRIPVEGGGEHPVLQPAPSFGDLWESNLHKRLVFQGGNPTGHVAIHASRGAGVWIPFLASTGGEYKPDSSIQDNLIEINSGWRYTDAATQALEIYSSTGVITSIQYANGASLTYTYSDASTPTSIAPTGGLLLAVQDHFGRSIQFTYELSTTGTSARIKSITDTEGHSIIPTYTSTGMLGALTWPDATSRRYVYELIDLPWAVTGVIDENATKPTTTGFESDF
jgi:hypothetical protein